MRRVVGKRVSWVENEGIGGVGIWLILEVARLEQNLA